MRMEIKYIENNFKLGILYDWRKIRRLYDSLGVPDEYYQIPWGAILQNKYFIDLSDRSTGKTTNWLLVGLCMNALYGTIVQYVRATEDELKPSHAEKLVEVVRSYNEGEYIKKLTDGRWNSIYYHWKQFFYCNVDEDGTRTETANKAIIQCLSVDRANDYKSTYNAPLGDFVLFDEFIGKYYRPDECIYFFDLTKTIFRDRHSPIIVMLANTINLSSPYFEEMEISRQVRGMQKGERKQCVTEKGTRIYVEVIDAEITKSPLRKKMNELFYGFKNPKLNAITGEALYCFESVPHIPKHDDSFYYIQRNIYIEAGVDLLRVEYCYIDSIGYHFEIKPAKDPHEDSYVLSLEWRKIRAIFGALAVTD